MQFSILTSSGLRGAPGYSLDQAHHLPIEMDPLIGMLTYPLLSVIKHHEQGKSELVLACASRGRVPPDLEAWEQAAGQEAEGSGLQSNARQREQTASAERQLLLKASVHPPTGPGVRTPRLLMGTTAANSAICAHFLVCLRKQRSDTFRQQHTNGIKLPQRALPTSHTSRKALLPNNYLWPFLDVLGGYISPLFGPKIFLAISYYLR